MVNCTYDDVRLIINTALTDANITSLIVLADQEITDRGFDTLDADTKKRMSMIFTAAMISLRDPDTRSIGEFSEKYLNAIGWNQVKADLITAYSPTTDGGGITPSAGLSGGLPFISVNEAIGSEGMETGSSSGGGGGSGSGGATTFIDLSDVPSSYTGQANKYPCVKAGEDGLEFVAGTGGDHGDLTGLSDDDHTQYLNNTRHDTTARHTLGSVVPHDALASLAEKNHANLTNVTADQHHARQHVINSSDDHTGSISNTQHGDQTAIPDSHHPSGNVKDYALGVKTGIKAGTNITITDVGGYANIASSGGGGVTDHGALTGLADDDHTQYLNNARHDTTDRHTIGPVVPHDALANLTEKSYTSLTDKPTLVTDHGALTGLADDDHTQYMLATGTRHDLTARHSLGTVVPHDAHSALTGLSNDDHTQYMLANGTRHDLTARHALGTVVPHDAFKNLTDVPASYTGSGGKFVKVNVGETALEFGVGYTSTLVTHAAISINGDSQFTSGNGVVGGSGTEVDPYIIENWSITASGANGILIQNTTAYFVIRNCYISGPSMTYAGIFLSTVSNGVVKNCLTYNAYRGIKIATCSNIRVQDNHFGNCATYDATGIWVETSSDILIIRNIADNHGTIPPTYNSSARGIEFDTTTNFIIAENNLSNNNHNGVVTNGSSYGVIANNYVHNVGYSGIDLYNGSHNITIVGNEVDTSAYGINLETGNYDNNVTGNNCSLCTHSGSGHAIGIWSGANWRNTVTGNCATSSDMGIHLENSTGTVVSGNSAFDNNRHGIWLYNTSDNVVVGNIVINNSLQTDNAYNGIRLDMDSNTNMISGNLVRYGTGNQHNYGIRIASSDCDANVVINNDIYHAGKTADYIDSGTTTIYHNNRTTAGWVA